MKPINFSIFSILLLIVNCIFNNNYNKPVSKSSQLSKINEPVTGILKEFYTINGYLINDDEVIKVVYDINNVSQDNKAFLKLFDKMDLSNLNLYLINVTSYTNKKYLDKINNLMLRHKICSNLANMEINYDYIEFIRTPYTIPSRKIKYPIKPSESYNKEFEFISSNVDVNYLYSIRYLSIFDKKCISKNKENFTFILESDEKLIYTFE